MLHAGEGFRDVGISSSRRRIDAFYHPRGGGLSKAILDIVIW
jgi:hypothetical protein